MVISTCMFKNPHSNRIRFILQKVLGVLVCISLMSGAGIVYADKKAALIISMSDYKSGKLPNVDSDTKTIGGVLGNLGFSVHYIENANITQLREELTQFKESMEEEEPDWLVVYYAGHGMQYQNGSYLLPIDSFSEITEPSDVGFEGMSLDRIFDRYLNIKTKGTVFLFDACRDHGMFQNHVDVGKGISASVPTVSDLHLSVLFSTTPGAYAYDGRDGNSPFAKAVIENIETPNQDLFEFYKAVQHRTTELTKKMSFGEQKPTFTHSGNIKPLTNDFFFIEKRDDNSCAVAWKNVIDSNRSSAACSAFTKSHTHCKNYISEATQCARAVSSTAEEKGKALYSECKKYYNGDGGKELNLDKALELCKEAAEHENKDAMIVLGDYYNKENNCGIEAIAYYEAAMKYNHRRAKSQIQKCNLK